MARLEALTRRRLRGGGILSIALFAGCGQTSGTIERVPIPPGATVRAVAESLAAHGVISSRSWFRIRARWSHVDRSIRAGIYQFARGAGTGAVLRELKSGDAVRFRLTLPIGATVFDLARSAQERLGLPAESLLRAADDSALLRQLGLPGPSVEGWLLPESFDFGGFDSARMVLTRFVAARTRSWDSAWDARAATAGLDRKEVLTLASIVEAEAKDPSERPEIAAVYRNRLRLHMPLQADPTIQYGYLVRDGQRKGRLYAKDYAFDSPWNTYRYPGLPPGPIGNPSAGAINAVLAPADVPYLYFVAGPDGRTLFATTYLQHVRNIVRLRKPGR